MSYGSYYEAPYYRNPVPYTSSDIGEPVPGWGVNPNVAGPARVGIGAMAKAGGAAVAMPMSDAMLRLKLDLTKMQDIDGTAAEPGAGGEEPPVPWWVWPIGAAIAMGTLGYVGTKKRWF